MVKTHNKTSLKYLCKTSTDNPLWPYKYLGSGKHWKRHLKKHGNDIKTEILEVCDSREKLIERGIYYSKLYNIVESKEFANMIEERGDGGPTMLGKKMPKKHSINKSKSLLKFYSNTTDNYKVWRKELNSKCHEKYRYYTPAGIFTNAFKAAVANKCSNVTVINKCFIDVDKSIESKKYWRFGWRGKTWRQLGWYGESLYAESSIPNQ